MSMMRTHRLTTYLQAEEACTLIEFLDQLRDMLLEAYGDDITAMLQQASAQQQQQREPMDLFDDEEPF
jgi:hypothetical protein